jgi:hypothetical protein
MPLSIASRGVQAHQLTPTVGWNWLYTLPLAAAVMTVVGLGEVARADEPAPLPSSVTSKYPPDFFNAPGTSVPGYSIPPVVNIPFAIANDLQIQQINTEITATELDVVAKLSAGGLDPDAIEMRSARR